MAIKASSRKRSGRTSSRTSSNRTSSGQIGLNQKQVSQLRGMKGIDQKALSAYEASGSVVGGRNNPRGRGRETTPVITPERVAPTEVADIPKMKAPTTDFSSILSMGNAGLTDPQNGLTQQNGQFVYDPSKSAAVNAAEEANQGNLNALAASAQFLKPKENELSDAYAQMERKAGIQNLQKDVNTYSSQLNSITSSRDAEMLKLEGQGRGQTQGFIGGEQARINREAAIQALPVQAQLAAAQGNLEMAQSRVNTLFQIKSQDIAAQNAYKTNLANSVMQYANAAQQNILNAKLGDIQKQEQREQQAIADAKNVAMQAIEYGQSSLASRVMELDPKSPTYQQDVNAALGQLRKPVAATAPKAPELQNFGTADAPIWKQYDFATGTWNDIDGVTGGTALAAAEQKESRANELATKINSIGNLKLHSGLNSAVGPNALSRIGLIDSFGAKDEFVGKVEQLVSQEFLDKLIDSKGQGATFGALTKPEQDALTAAATAIGFWRVTDDTGKAIGYDIDEQSFKDELDTLITLAQKAESQERGYDVTLVPSYDSQLIDALTQEYLAQSVISNFNPANHY